MCMSQLSLVPNSFTRCPSTFGEVVGALILKLKSLPVW